MCPRAARCRAIDVGRWAPVSRHGGKKEATSRLERRGRSELMRGLLGDSDEPFYSCLLDRLAQAVAQRDLRLPAEDLLCS